MAREYILHKTPLDNHGQPIPKFNASRIAERSFDELIGICKGIIADGDVNDWEAGYLDSWLKANPETLSKFPGDVLFERVQRIFTDGRVDADERLELAELIKTITGEGEHSPASQLSTKAFFEEPEPTVYFPEKSFSFTGKFVSGTRSWCIEQVITRGGIAHDKPIKTTNFLIVGTAGSRDWVHTILGRKIEKAVEYRNKYGVKIVSEEHWSKFL